MVRVYARGGRLREVFTWLTLPSGRKWDFAQNHVHVILWLKILRSSIDKKTPGIASRWQDRFPLRLLPCALHLPLLGCRFPENPGGCEVRHSAILCLLFIVGSLLSGQTSFGQVQPSVKGLKATGERQTWDIFMGGSWESSASQNTYGWDGSVSEYPYRSHPWIGGTVDTSGYYYNKQAPGSQLFPIMGGPSVVANGRRIRLFARCMAGAVLDRVSATRINLLSKGNESEISMGGAARLPSAPTVAGPASTTDNLAVSGGGGVDIPAGSRFAIRGQADWITYWAKSQGQFQLQDVIRASGGIVLRF
jgi:hypothetical protein